MASALVGFQNVGTLLTSDDRNREPSGMIAAIMPCHRQPPITAGQPRAPTSGTRQGKIRRRPVLGGLINQYEPAA